MWISSKSKGGSKRKIGQPVDIIDLIFPNNNKERGWESM